MGKNLVNYLDDYLFCCLLKQYCNYQVQTFLDTCKEINFPVSLEKTFWGDTKMTFLGFLIDTIRQIVGIPVEKITRALNLIEFVLNKANRKITV